MASASRFLKSIHWSRLSSGLDIRISSHKPASFSPWSRNTSLLVVIPVRGSPTGSPRPAVPNYDGARTVLLSRNRSLERRILDWRVLQVDRHPFLLRVVAGLPLPSITGMLNAGSRYVPDCLIMATILLVDDDDESLWMLQLVFERSGHHVLLAGTGEPALAIAARHLHDLIITDRNMPGMDGMGLCERLKFYPALAQIPVVMTGEQQRGAVRQGLQTLLGARCRHARSVPASQSRSTRVEKHYYASSAAGYFMRNCHAHTIALL